MPLTLNRDGLHLNAVALPATKTAGALTISSDVFSDFYDSGLASVELELVTDRPSKITDTLTVQPYVSYDKGVSWLKSGGAAYTDLISSAGTAEVTKILFSSNTLADWAGKYFILYDGTTPTVFWFDHSGAATVPTVAGFTGWATFTKCDISAVRVDTLDHFGTDVEVVIEAATGSTWATSWSTDTLTITAAEKRKSTNANPGNLLTTTAVATNFGVSTQGASVDALKTIALAPYFKVEAIFNGSGALASGHGTKINVKMKELNINYRRKIWANCLTLAASYTAKDYFEVTTSALATDGLDQFKKVYMAVYAPDTSKVLDTVKYILETSDDGTNWRAGSAEITSLVNGSTVLNTVTEVTSGSSYYLGKYIRVKMYATDATGGLSSGHAIKVNVVGLY